MGAEGATTLRPRPPVGLREAQRAAGGGSLKLDDVLAHVESMGHRGESQHRHLSAG